jgi:hypothetical protein
MENCTIRTEYRQVYRLQRKTAADSATTSWVTRISQLFHPLT